MIRNLKSAQPRPLTVPQTLLKSVPAPTEKQSTGQAVKSSDQFVGKPRSVAAPASPPPNKAAIATITEASLRGMSNAQLLQIADTPVGAAALKKMGEALKQRGPMTPARAQQLHRISAATFAPGAGLKITGTPANTKAYLQLTKRTMLESPSFAKMMTALNADAKHPLKITVDRNIGTRMDGFNSQTLDLSDIENLPVRPKGQEITQGEVLAHAMREQREKANGTATRNPAHAKAIDSENDYRRDIGQTSMRKAFPNDQTETDTPPFGSVNVIHFDDGRSEALFFNAAGNFTFLFGP